MTYEVDDIITVLCILCGKRKKISKTLCGDQYCEHWSDEGVVSVKMVQAFYGRCEE